MRGKIVIDNCNKSFGDVVVLQNVSLNILDGESIVILGGSGSGKSVLVKCIAGLLQADVGSVIRINGIEVSQMSVSERPHSVRKLIGMLFQSNALFDSLTVSENITFGVYNKISKYGYINAQQRAELNKLAKENIDVVGLAQNNLEKYPYELSGGMQKRVAIARLISTKPEVILLDEPTTGLDPVTSYNISHLMLQIQQHISATMVTVTHDPIYTSEVAKKVVLIDKKTIAWYGPFKNIRSVDNPYLDAFKRCQH